MFRLRKANSDWPLVSNEMALTADQLCLLQLKAINSLVNSGNFRQIIKISLHVAMNL